MGRYIDEEKIKITADTMIADGECYVPLLAVKQAIARTPTEDVEEIRHGRWVSNKLDGYKLAYYCSECSWIDGYPFNNRHKYCPHCGAKMDEKGDHNG